jgi:hypothetical protein
MPRDVRYDAWSGSRDWDAGVHRGTRVSGDVLVVDRACTAPEGSDEVAAWASTPVEAGFDLTELVASWSAETPAGSWVEVRVVGPDDHGHVLGHWSSGTAPTRRTSVAGDPEVDTDVWRPVGGAGSYRLAVLLHRLPGSRGPRVRGLAAVASAGEARASTSPPSGRRGRVLDVPRLTQMTWRGGGGEGWCAPTAVSMVLAHAGRLPPGTDIPAAAREVFDPAYDGTGNWSFNAAWAATLADHAFVTRLHDLREAERFVDAGIPLVASVAYPAGALRGAPTRGTDGHLLVICGFTDDGDVVTHDPAAPTERSVRRTYRRAELERAWLAGSGGTVLVVHDDDRPLPARGRGGAW